jgi:hypothetical protein
MYVRHIFEVEDRQRVCVEDEEEAGCQKEIGFDATFVFPISKISESQLISGESFKGDSEGWDEYEMPNINHITPESPSRDMLLYSYWPQITEKSRFCSLGVIYVSRYPEQQQLSHVCQVVPPHRCQRQAFLSYPNAPTFESSFIVLLVSALQAQ